MSMRRFSSFQGPWPLAVAAFVVLAGCSSSSDEAEVCAGVECTAGLCYADEGQPQCRCVDWEQAAGMTCEKVTPQMRVDDHGNAPAEATVLAGPDAVVEGSLQLASQGIADRDVFRFTAEALHLYRVSCEAPAMLECRVRLLDASGAELGAASSDEPEVPARLFFDPPQQATVFFVEVSGRLAGRVGAYSLQVTRVGVDDHGNIRESATVVQPSGESFDVTTGYLDDVDVLTFRSQAGHGYRFGCESGVSPSPWLQLRSALGAPVEYRSYPDEGLVSVGVKAQGEASWFVEVGTERVSGPVTYRCRLEDLGADMHADVLAGATPLTSGSAVTLRMEARSDVDVLSFTGTPGHIYRIDTRGTVILTDATGTQLERWEYGGAYHEVKVAGTYYLHVSAASTWGSSFPLMLEDLGLDDHGNGVETATRIAVGDTVTGLLHVQHDVDAISFMAEEAGVYRVTCTPECQMNFSAASGWVSRLTQVDGFLIDARATEPITLLVHGTGLGSPRFTLRLERVGTDDHGDDADHATPLTLPASVSGALQSGVDIDAFSVVLEAGRAYLLESVTPSAPVEVVMPDGSTRWGRFTVPASGSYLVRVHRSDGTYRTGPWNFTLRQE